VDPVTHTHLPQHRLSQDFQGDRGDAVAGRNYFINRFRRLANHAGRVLDKDVFIQYIFLFSLWDRTL
jgi:hypothetical protein